jgi:hypothetical protein
MRRGEILFWGVLLIVEANVYSMLRLVQWVLYYAVL